MFFTMNKGTLELTSFQPGLEPRYSAVIALRFQMKTVTTRGIAW